MTTLTEDDVLEQLDAQNNLLSFMTTAHNILLQGIKRFLPSLFVNNDEEIVEYAVKPLLAQSGPLDDIDVALRLIYALGKWINGFMPTLPIFPVLSVPERAG
jgi:DNA-binding MltR family transcriptional regulator